ncbi:hypothetical protein VBM87_02570 [Mycoplasma sp. 744]|uniref:hypothetical protein n=1 Tax=unclassified Mycoplasma TaxID=2683645 RepID=UPI00211C7DBA|nr:MULTISPECIES: hypothetical protein [unclassified Mycoplasma]MEA4115652.1 hypothetical protein [Mycoplasma sp. 744]UUM19119.1 hypothetical protein NPA14_02170 [Mycoplasma sp. 1018B]
MLKNYETFLDENYEHFRKNVVDYNLKKDSKYVLHIVFSFLSLLMAIWMVVLLAVAIFNYQLAPNNVVRWVLTIATIVFVIISLITASWTISRIKKVKNNYVVKSEDLLLKPAYELAGMKYEGKGPYPRKIQAFDEEVFTKSTTKWDSLDWVTDSLMLSELPKDANLKFVLGHVFYNKNNETKDKWKIQNIRIGVSDQDVDGQILKTNSYLFMEGKIHGRNFEQSYLFGPKFPLNFSFPLEESIIYNLHTKYQLLSDVEKLNEEGFENIIHYVEELNLWDKGFGFYIDKHQNKIYSWIKLDRELFKWQDEEYPAHNILRDVYLIDLLQNLPLQLD